MQWLPVQELIHWTKQWVKSGSCKLMYCLRLASYHGGFLDAGLGCSTDRKPSKYTEALPLGPFRWRPFAASHVGYAAEWKSQESSQRLHGATSWVHLQYCAESKVCLICWSLQKWGLCLCIRLMFIWSVICSGYEIFASKSLFGSWMHCRIIIILDMEIVASREEIVGDPKPLGAGQEQQATGTGSNLLQQQEKSIGASAA